MRLGIMAELTELLYDGSCVSGPPSDGAVKSSRDPGDSPDVTSPSNLNRKDPVSSLAAAAYCRSPGPTSVYRGHKPRKDDEVPENP